MVDCRLRASTEAGRFSADAMVRERDRAGATRGARMEGKVDREVGYRARGEDGPRADTGKKQNRRAPLSRLRPIEEGDFFYRRVFFWCDSGGRAVYHVDTLCVG